ncbi:MAG: trypsin-like peptidase domain-containing protein [Clostridia bacterium]|nr:trypsin-like peptidase domain-containing protein [Clostridia bacterium]
MKKFVVFLFLICISLSFSSCGSLALDNTVDMTPRLISSTTTMSSSDVVNVVRSAIVGISATLPYGTSLGSGVAVADGGYILTNQHVIVGATKIKVYFADKDIGNASLIWSDSSLDIAIIKSEKNIPYLATSPLSEVSVGDDVLAVGTPISLQFQHTVTKGIVSALNRTLEIQSISGYTTYMQNLIQHDASINAGNSGGPLINSMGKIIGINSLKASDAEGIGFAIPIETATTITARIIPNNNFQQVNLGIFGCDAELARFKEQTDQEKGVYIIDILKDSPISSAELNIGDVITGINSSKITNMLDFRKAIYSLNKGDKVDISYVQNGTQKTISIVAK